MIEPSKMKEYFEGKLSDLDGMECLQLCQAALTYPLEGIKPKDYVLEYLYEAAKVVRLLNPTEEYAQSYKYRRDLIDGISEACLFDTYEYDRLIEPQLKNRLRSRYNYISENKLSLQSESALLGSSPIVPYTGTVRKTRPTTEPFTEEVIKACRNKKTKDDIDKMIKFKIETEAYEFLSDINADLVLEDPLVLTTLLLDNCISTENAILVTDIIQEYVGEVSDLVLLSIESLFTDNDVDSEALENYSVEDIISIYNEDDLDALESLQSYNSDKLADLLSRANLLRDDEGTAYNKYDFQELLDYITNNFHLQSSEYANSLLTDIGESISDLFDYDDMLIAEINDTELCAAVVDVSNGNTPVLVCIDRGGNITEEIMD